MHKAQVEKFSLFSRSHFLLVLKDGFSISNHSFAFLQIQENRWEMEQTGTPVPEGSQPTCLPMEGVVVGQGKTGLPLKQIYSVFVVSALTGG